MLKYCFIADYFDIAGGAEFSDSALRSFLGGEQVLIRSAECTVQQLSKLKNCRFIISNFVALSEECKTYISQNLEYIIYEHDHKYLKSRNPSIFKDFKAPYEQLVNMEFYSNARSVVCQTKQHMDVIFKNTGLKNLINFGGSLWTEEQLSFLQTITNVKDREHEKTFAVLNSDIVHKGTKEAVDWCHKEDVSYKLLNIKEWKEHVKELSECDVLVFFPRTLETCSRMAVEARMLGLRVIANTLVSAIHEDWFRKYKGLDLINYFREKNKSIPQFIDRCFKVKDTETAISTNITVILNLYKRPQNLQKQIDAFLNQTVKPKEIWVWQNCPNEEGIPQKDQEYRGALSCNGIDKWITSNSNWGVYGRFTMAQMAQTEFVCVNDDDTIPGPRWLETCLESYSANPGLQGGIGVKLHGDNYQEHSRIGWAEPRPTTEEVDLVGHSWFFHKSHLKYLWMEEPFTWNMEDAHFSYCLQKYGNIKTYVPPQIEKDRSSSVLGYELGIDEAAMSNPKNHTQFYSERDAAIKYYLNNGWKKVTK